MQGKLKLLEHAPSKVDLLGNQDIADQLCEVILATKAEQSSTGDGLGRVVALLGQWGAGTSTVYQFLSSKKETENDFNLHYIQMWPFDMTPRSWKVSVAV